MSCLGETVCKDFVFAPKDICVPYQNGESIVELDERRLTGILAPNVAAATDETEANVKLAIRW